MTVSQKCFPMEFSLPAYDCSAAVFRFFTNICRSLPGFPSINMIKTSIGQQIGLWKNQQLELSILDSK